MSKFTIELFCYECGDTDVKFDEENFIVNCVHGCGEKHELIIKTKINSQRLKREITN